MLMSRGQNAVHNHNTNKPIYDKSFGNMQNPNVWEEQ
jgi:hypothetical protein